MPVAKDQGHVAPRERQGEERPPPQGLPGCLMSSDQSGVLCEVGPLRPCPLHRPQDGHICQCGAYFCAAHSRQTSATGQHDGQAVSAAPQAAQAEGAASAPSGARAQGAAEARMAVATAVSREGCPGPFPYVSRMSMSNFYDAVGMATAARAIRDRGLDSVPLPHAAVNNGIMPIHLDTFAEQLPVQFQFRDIRLRQDDITLSVYDLRARVVIPAGPPGQLRAYTVTNGHVATDNPEGPPFTPTVTYMCPSDLPTPALTPGPGGAVLLVADCPQAPVASAGEALAGTSLRMVRKQKMAELIVTVKLEVDPEARRVTLTPPGGTPWTVAYRNLARFRDDGNGVMYLTFSAARLQELRPLSWRGWPVSWTEWLIQTHSGNPMIAMQAPPGGEDDTASAAAVFAAMSARSARPLPCDVADAGRDAPEGAIAVSLVLRHPTDPRRNRHPGSPVLPGQVRPPEESLAARGNRGKGGQGKGKGGKRPRPPRPAPKSAASPRSEPRPTTQTTLQNLFGRTRDAK